MGINNVLFGVCIILVSIMICCLFMLLREVVYLFLIVVKYVFI